LVPIDFTINNNVA